MNAARLQAPPASAHPGRASDGDVHAVVHMPPRQHGLGGGAHGPPPLGPVEPLSAGVLAVSATNFAAPVTLMTEPPQKHLSTVQ